MRCPQCQSEFPAGTHCPFDGTALVSGAGWGERGGSTPADPYIGRVLDDRYRVLERLGEGAMAVVFRGEDVIDGRAVAIKILKPTRDDDMLERFRREAQVVSRLTSPNTVRLYGYGEQGGTLYLALEQLEGTTLDAQLEKGPLSPRRALTIVREVCDALEEAHGHGMIHRDLKPANIFVTQGGTAKVLDFGIAKVVSVDPGATMGMMALAQPLTQMGAVMGTPTYMAPEQARDEPLDGRTDLYALGVVAYHAIAGQPPFVGAPGQVIFQHTHKAPPPLPPEVDPRIAALVMRLLEKDPAARPSSAASLARQIDAVLGVAPRSGEVPRQRADSGADTGRPQPRWGLRAGVMTVAVALFAGAAAMAHRQALHKAPPAAVPSGLVAIPLDD